MRYDEVDINLAENLHLMSEITLDNKVYPKGYALTKEDIIIFKMHGIDRLSGIFTDENDLDYQTILGIVAAKLCGNNTAYTIDESGICQIVSVIDGFFSCNEKRLDKFNRLNDCLTLNIAEPFRKVNNGEIIACLECCVPAMMQNDVDDILFKLSGNTEMLSIAPLKQKKAALIYTKTLDNKTETKHFTNVVKKLVKEFSPLDVEFGREFNTSYHIEAIADTLQDCLREHFDVIFMLPAAYGSGKNDVIAQGLEKVVDDIYVSHFPQIGACDLLVAEKGKNKIISLPYGYDKIDTQRLNKIIKQAVFSEKISTADFDRRRASFVSSGQKLDEKLYSSLIVGKNHGNTKKANIGAVILAAGIGSRTGRNKLMVELKDETPLFMRAVNAALGSDASPVFIITGYHDEEMQDYLENIDINVLYNPAYRSGIKTSIALGLKSIPSFCEGAVLIPADMPNITAADINKLIASYKKGKEKQLCMFMHNGEKANPIIWSSALYDKADLVPENPMLRPVFVEHADYTTCVDIKNDEKFLDVNYPSDIEKLLKK